MRSAVAIEMSEFQGNVCFAVFEEEKIDDWFLDLGASSYMMSRADLLNNIEGMRKRNVILAEDEKMLCNTKGETVVSADNGRGCTVPVLLKDVKVVPGLSSNLVNGPAIIKRANEIDTGRRPDSSTRSS